jgi:cytochrome P450
VTLSRADVPDVETTAVPFFPMPKAAACPLDPAPELAELQARAPLVRVRLWDGSTPWLVTRHAEQRALLADRRVSADWMRPGYPFIDQYLRDAAHEEGRFLTTMDDPEHGRLRRMILGHFTFRKIERLRPAVQRIVDDHIDALLASPKPADFVAEFAMPIPTLVISRLLGVPYEDHDFFRRATMTLISRGIPAEVMHQTQGELYRYLDQLVGRKLEAPDNDLLSRLATERLATGQLPRHELLMMALFLMIAGHETTASMISLATLALLLHPEQLAVLKDADAPGIAAAVEELLRYLGAAARAGRRRLALEDIEIAGQVIRAGEGLVFPDEIGNRDERVYPGAGVLDLRRDASQHLTFGFGAHQCVGQVLARLELQVVFATLFRRIPTLALAVGLGDLPFMNDGIGVGYGVYEMPVTW